MNNTSQSPIATRRSLWGAWTHYWFAADESAPIVASRIRTAVCAAVAVWFLSFFPQANLWFGESGLLPVSMGARLVEFEEKSAWLHWSPLWWIDNPTWLRGYLLLGAACASVASLRMGGRYLLLATLVLSIGWIHRIVWLQGAVEPLIPAFLAYLALDSGRRDGAQPLWISHLVVRLFQTHWWMIVAVGLLSQLARIEWWQGDAAWWLAAYGRSHLLSLEQLSGNAWMVNGFTHGLIVVQAVALWLLVVPAARWLGLASAVVALLGIGFVADHTLYALLLGAGLLSFSPTKYHN